MNAYRRVKKECVQCKRTNERTNEVFDYNIKNRQIGNKIVF